MGKAGCRFLKLKNEKGDVEELWVCGGGVVPCPRCLEENVASVLRREGEMWKCDRGHEFWPCP